MLVIRPWLQGENRSVVSITVEKLEAVKSRLKDLSEAINGLAHSANDGYIGCYVDDWYRHLDYRVSNVGNTITLAKCREHCKGYKYTGLQYGTYCLCGNTLENKKYPKVKESDCNMPCAVEPNRMCGGGYRNSIYLVKP
ncbi:sialate:O-sulfotransferase 2-like isoform X3 [Mytilus trossulus]|uniref:sialate:O-sulfotransferase 2-like isoform X3 n=1 Tax=Mytilus trossulus TaxID=6551 RepID=UPI003006FA53